MINSYDTRYKKVANYCKRHNYNTDNVFPASWNKEEKDLANFIIMRHLVQLELKNKYLEA